MNAPVRAVTLGCRLNALDSERMVSLATRIGLHDTVIVNSCAVTAEAVRQSRQAIRRARRQQPGARILATGCATEINPDSFGRMPEVDGVIPNLDKLRSSCWAGLGADDTGVTMAEEAPRRARAYVEIQNGCDHRCTFCVIPFGRGPSRSVPARRVVREVRARVQAGYREVVLTGVDLTSYGADFAPPAALGDLVAAILAQVPTLPRLRLSSLDAAEVDPRLDALLCSESRLMPHVHLSLQAGDNLILKRMKRRHSREDAVRFCARLKRGRDIAIGADLIAGFPTETEAMFENTLRLVDDCALDYLHVFPFSSRLGVPASRMPQLPRDLVRARAARLRTAGDRRRNLRLAGRVGGRERVLVESPRRGRTECHAEVDFATPRSVQEVGTILSTAISGCENGRLQAD